MVGYFLASCIAQKNVLCGKFVHTRACFVHTWYRSRAARSVLSEVMHFSSSSLIEILLHILETFASASLLRDAAVMSVR
jgi:hypothetical protein